MNKHLLALVITLIITLFSLLSSLPSYAAKTKTQEKNLVIVTIDGLRWQEVFTGADLPLINNEKFVRDSEQLKQEFWHKDEKKRRELLMPFFWQTIAQKGVVIGNRNIGSLMSVSNNWYFSYPGYSEIFTGVADNSLNSNAKVPNPQTSFIEWLNPQSSFDNKLAVFGSWDVFPAIFNTERSKLHVNAGFMPAQGYNLSAEAKLLNELQKEIPSPWHNVRLDSFTYRFAKDYLLAEKPRVLAISFGETDDFAHDGHYDSYLNSTQQTDAFIADLWQTLQTTAGYKDNTYLLITTDHGRGSNANDWQHHASKQAALDYMKNLDSFPEGIVGSEHIWFAAIGPNIKAKGEVTTQTEVKQNQIAATALKLLGKNPHKFNNKAGSIIKEVF
ncbi:MAG: alkaline phosphatase family protein [Colwellia sp.]